MTIHIKLIFDEAKRSYFTLSFEREYFFTEVKQLLYNFTYVCHRYQFVRKKMQRKLCSSIMLIREK